MRAVHDRDLGQDRSQRLADTAECPPDASEVVRLTKEASYIVGLVARRYAACGVALEDLVAAGNVGLVLAAHRFDARKGAQFSTYAVWWVRKEILEAIGSERFMIRVPRYASDLRRRALEDGEAGFSVRSDGPNRPSSRSCRRRFRDDDSRALEERIADPGRFS
jgi:RNA polymerase sigma factor (sigma-70 family)